MHGCTTYESESSQGCEVRLFSKERESLGDRCMLPGTASIVVVVLCVRAVLEVKVRQRQGSPSDDDKIHCIRVISLTQDSDELPPNRQQPANSYRFQNAGDSRLSFFFFFFFSKHVAVHCGWLPPHHYYPGGRPKIATSKEQRFSDH